MSTRRYKVREKQILRVICLSDVVLLGDESVYLKSCGRKNNFLVEIFQDKKVKSLEFDDKILSY